MCVSGPTIILLLYLLKDRIIDPCVRYLMGYQVVREDEVGGEDWTALDSSAEAYGPETGGGQPTPMDYEQVGLHHDLECDVDLALDVLDADVADDVARTTEYCVEGCVEESRERTKVKGGVGVVNAEERTEGGGPGSSIPPKVKMYVAAVTQCRDNGTDNGLEEASVAV